MAINRPPNLLSEADESLLGLVKDLASHQEVHIAGDFNAPPIDWENTQLRGDLIQTYRIVRGCEFALEVDEFFELAGTDRLRGHSFKLQRRLAQSDFRRNAFSHRVNGYIGNFYKRTKKCANVLRQQHGSVF
nr:unnamed protein product [Spirometra erinaceieuropaei]